MKIRESHAPRADRFAGCLLGLAVGDALGAPYEGLTHADIFFQFGSADALVKNPSGDTLFYTDDTEMMFGVAETLAECGHIDETHLCRAFAENYHPERGYGQGRAAHHRSGWRRESDYQALAANIFFPAARSEMVPQCASLRSASCSRIHRINCGNRRGYPRSPTHLHPLGIEARATLLAFAVAWALRATPPSRPQGRVLSRTARTPTTEEFRWHLEVAAKLKPSDSLAGLGSTLHAHRSVITAIACFAASPE